LLGDVGRHYLVPVGVARQHLFAGPDMVVARTGAGGIAAILNRHDRLAQHAPRLPDRLVARAEVFLRAVDDRPHAFLQRAVLLVDAVDPGVALGALHFAVEPVIVRPVLFRTERLLIDKIGPVADAVFPPILL